MIPLWVIQKVDHVLRACRDGHITLQISDGIVKKIETTEVMREPKEKETKVLVA